MRSAKRGQSVGFVIAVVSVGALSLLAPRRARADQSGAGVLTGIVVDGADKKPLADVVIMASSPAQQGQQIVVSDSAGYFLIPHLPSGVYSITFDKGQYRPYTREGINLPADATI